MRISFEVLLCRNPDLLLYKVETTGYIFFYMICSDLALISGPLLRCKIVSISIRQGSQAGMGSSRRSCRMGTILNKKDSMPRALVNCNP